MRYLIGDHTQSKRMLKLRDAPRLTGDNLLMTGSEQKQIRHHGNAKGLLNPLFMTTDLVLAQAQVRFQLAVDLLHRPAALIAAHYHGDATDVTKTQTFAVKPVGFAPLGARQTGHPSPLVMCLGQMCHQIFNRFVLSRLPGLSNGKDKAPAALGIGLIAFDDHVHVVLGAITGIAFDHDRVSPAWGHKALDHVTEEIILLAVLRMRLRSNGPKRHGQAIVVPIDDEQGEAHGEKPGLVRTFAAFLGQGGFSCRVWVSRCHRLPHKKCHLWGVARYGGLLGPIIPPRHGHPSKPHSTSGESATP